MLELLLIALALGLSNFAASIGIGISGVDRDARIRIAVAFGVFEAGMPIIGLAIGAGLANALGSAAPVIGGIVLIGVGAQSVYSARMESEGSEPLAGAGFGRLLLLGAALSVDNLVVGFALGAKHVSLLISVIAITTVSVGLSLVGLELGNRLGSHVAHRSGLVGGVVLIGVGIALMTNVV